MTRDSQRVLFDNREAAGRRLAERLRPLAGDHPLVLGVPRGGVPVAAVVAEALGGDLDVVLVHKLGSPESPELAIGSVDERGTLAVNQLGRVGVPGSWVRFEAARQLESLRRRRQTLAGDRPPARAAGRTVLVVDDGAASGATMSAALTLVRREHPARLVAALPVAPSPTVAELEWLADDVVCLAMPSNFASIGQCYGDFPEVTDEEAARILAPRRPPPPRPADVWPAFQP